jgi:hypothetical protein
MALPSCERLTCTVEQYKHGSPDRSTVEVDMPSPEDLEIEEWSPDDDEDGCTDGRCVCGADD